MLDSRMNLYDFHSFFIIKYLEIKNLFFISLSFLINYPLRRICSRKGLEFVDAYISDNYLPTRIENIIKCYRKNTQYADSN